MCRSIKVLRQNDGEPSELEIREAARQFVRKISGYRHPSQANVAAFQRAVDDAAGGHEPHTGDFGISPGHRRNYWPRWSTAVRQAVSPDNWLNRRWAGTCRLLPG